MNQLSLFELNQLVRATLDTHLEPSYWVIAEIANLSVNQKGHCYMELVQKDQEMVIAKIRANIWSYTYRKLGSWFEGITGMPLKQGIKVLFNVEVQFHEVYGMSLTVKDVDPNFTLGERARNRQEVIQQLTRENLIDKNKQLDLPQVPQCIAIISSPTAAGYEDFLKQVHGNIYGYAFEIKLFKSLMQGFEAEKNIIHNLEQIAENSKYYDVVVIIRGGGSQVDMDCFDSYKLARQISLMPIPVITGIGHDRDQSIVDIVAHTDLHTPTAVGEFLVTGLMQFESKLLDIVKKLKQTFEKRFYKENTELNNYKNKIRILASNLLQREKNGLNNYKTRLMSGVNFAIRTSDQILTQLQARVELLNPNHILKRGYTITTHNGLKIDSNSNIKKGDTLKTYTINLLFESTVQNEKKRKQKNDIQRSN